MLFFLELNKKASIIIMKNYFKNTLNFGEKNLNIKKILEIFQMS